MNNKRRFLYFLPIGISLERMRFFFLGVQFYIFYGQPKTLLKVNIIQKEISMTDYQLKSVELTFLNIFKEYFIFYLE